MPRKYPFQGSWLWPQPQSDPPPSIPRVKKRSVSALESVSWGKRAGVSHIPWCPPEVEAGMMKRQGIGSPTPVLLVWEVLHCMDGQCQFTKDRETGRLCPHGCQPGHPSESLWRSSMMQMCWANHRPRKLKLQVGNPRVHIRRKLPLIRMHKQQPKAVI